MSASKPKFLNPFIPLVLFIVGIILAAWTPVGFLFILAGIITTIYRYGQACSIMRADKMRYTERSYKIPSSSQKTCIEPTCIEPSNK